jgi:phage-related baseplate assembly protein
MVDVTYNSTVAEIQKVLDREENKILGLDIMVREAWPLNFSISCSLTYLPGYSPTTVQQDVKKTLYSYVKNLPLGSKVNRSDIINVIEDVSGVDAVINLQFNPDMETIQALPIEFLNLKEVVIR